MASEWESILVAIAHDFSGSLLADAGDGEDGEFQGLAGVEAEEFLVERTVGGEQGDFHACVRDDDAAGSGSKEEEGGVTLEVGLDECSGVDGGVGFEIRQNERFKDAEGVGKFIDLAGLADGEV